MSSNAAGDDEMAEYVSSEDDAGSLSEEEKAMDVQAKDPWADVDYDEEEDEDSNTGEEGEEETLPESKAPPPLAESSTIKAPVPLEATETKQSSPESKAPAPSAAVTETKPAPSPLNDRFAETEKYLRAAQEKAKQTAQKASSLAEQVEAQNKLIANLKSQAETLKKQASQTLSQKQKAEASLGNQRESLTSAESIAARRLAEIDRLKAELQESEQRYLNECTRGAAALSELEDLRSGNVPAKLELQRLRVEVGVKTQHAEWQKTRFEEQTVELLEERRKKTAIETELRSNVQRLEAGVSSAESQIASLRVKNERLDESNRDLLQQINRGSENLASAEAAIEASAAKRDKLKAAYERAQRDAEGQVEELKSKCTELQSAYRNVLEKSNEKIVAFKENAKKINEASKKAAEEIISGLRGELSAAQEANAALKSEMDEARRNPPQDSALESLNEMSGTAAAAELEKRGVSTTTLYTRLMREGAARRDAEAQVSRLQAYLDRILLEIESKAPAVAAQRKEFERALKSHDELNDRLVASMKETAAARGALQRSDEARARAEERCSVLERDAQNLARQVRTLLVPDSINDDDLVTFRSVEELQQKNQQLHALVAKLRTQDVKENKSGDENSKRDVVQDMQKQVEEMRSARQRQEQMVAAIVQQRDMYRILLQQADSSYSKSAEQPPAALDIAAPPQGVDYASLLDETKKDFDAFRESTLKASQDADKALAHLREQLSAAKLRASQMESMSDFQKSRCEHAAAAEQAASEEAKAARSDIAGIRSAMLDMQKLMQERANDLIEAREALSRSKSSAANLASERDLYADEASRLRERVDEVTEQRNAQTKVVGMLREMEASQRDSRSAMVASLQRDKSKLEGECEALRAEAKSDRSEYQTRISELARQLKRAENNLEDARSAAAALSEERAKVGASLQVAKEKESLLRMQLEGASKSARQSAAPSSVAPGEREEQVRSLTLQAENQRAKIAAQERDIEAYRSISEANEVALRKLAEEGTAIKALHEQKVASMSTNLASLKKALADTREKLSGASSAVESATRELKEKLEKERKKTSALQSANGELKARLEHAESMSGQSKGDVENLKRIARQAREKYNAELQGHAADMAKLTEMATRIGSLESAKREAEAKLAGAAAAAGATERSFAEQKATMERRISTLDAQLADTNRQSELLAEQLAKISADLAKQSETGAAASDAIASEDDQSEVGRLRELHQIALRHKDMCIAEKEDAEFRLARANRKIEALGGELSRAKAELQREVEQESSARIPKAEHERLLAAVQENTVLRNMNAYMTSEFEGFKKKLAAVEKVKSSLQASIGPLKKRAGSLAAEKSALESSASALKKECQLYRSRYEKIVSSFEGKIDPEEHQKVASQLKAKTEAFDNLSKAKAQSDAKVEKMKSLAVKFRKESKDAREKVASLSKQAEDASKLAAQLAAKDKEIAKLSNANERFRGALKRKQEQLKKAQTGASSPKISGGKGMKRDREEAAEEANPKRAKTASVEAVDEPAPDGEDGSAGTANATMKDAADDAEQQAAAKKAEDARRMHEKIAKIKADKAAADARAKKAEDKRRLQEKIAKMKAEIAAKKQDEAAASPQLKPSKIADDADDAKAKPPAAKKLSARERRIQENKEKQERLRRKMSAERKKELAAKAAAEVNESPEEETKEAETKEAETKEAVEADSKGEEKKSAVAPPKPLFAKATFGATSVFGSASATFGSTAASASGSLFGAPSSLSGSAPPAPVFGGGGAAKAGFVFGQTNATLRGFGDKKESGLNPKAPAFAPPSKAASPLVANAKKEATEAQEERVEARAKSLQASASSSSSTPDAKKSGLSLAEKRAARAARFAKKSEPAPKKNAE